MIFNVPWGHHKLILDKVKGDINKVKVKVKVNVKAKVKVEISQG